MILCYVYFSVLFVFQVTSLNPEGCDPSSNSLFSEGILGQVGMFPWLGVIRVELYEGDSIRIALTGAVLVKQKFALTIADDIARMPRRIFERDSKALFIPNDGQRWLCQLKKFTTHPEYPAIMNSIALIELELEVRGPVSLVPVCWPAHSHPYNSTNQLYILGLTDANEVLEKEVYKVRHVGQTQCIQWYNGEGLISNNDRWREYQCVATVNKKKNCLHETGMALATNDTGTWTLLGFGVHGPGCASPSRFIDLYKYIPWIASTTADPEFKRKYEKQGLRGGRENNEEVPLHDLYKSRKQNEINIDGSVVPWIFDRYESGLVPEIVRLDRDSIVLFDNKYELNKGDCKTMSKLIYTDSVKLVADRQSGVAHYQLSLMDLSVFNFSCVFLQVNSKKRSKAELWYNYGNFIDTLEGVDDTPKQLVKKYPKPERTTAEPDERVFRAATTNKPKRSGRRLINNKRRYKKLVSDTVIDELLAIKRELETTRKELNITGKADINKTFKKMLAVNEKLKNVRDKLGSPAPDSLKDSINILDTAASELRAGQVFYQGKLMDVRQQEVQQSIDLIQKFREQPEYEEIDFATDKPKVEETIRRPKVKGRQGKKKPWKPHKLLEPEYITDKPGWWLYYPHLNLELKFHFDSEAELSIEIWSNLMKMQGTRAPKTKPTRTRNQTDEDYGRSGDGTMEENVWYMDSSENKGPREMPHKEYLEIKKRKEERKKRVNETSFRKSSKFKYSELKRAEYDDYEMTNRQGIQLIDDPQKDGSNIIRSERIFELTVVLYSFIFNLIL